VRLRIRFTFQKVIGSVFTGQVQDHWILLLNHHQGTKFATNQALQRVRVAQDHLGPACRQAGLGATTQV